MAVRFLKILIGLYGFSGVALGAFGAHALKARLVENGHWETWHTAVMYQLIHTVAALAVWVFISTRSSQSRAAVASIGCWLAGVLLFSGSLYALSLTGPKWLGPVTPAGGLLLIAGWGCLIFVRTRPSSGA